MRAHSGPGRVTFARTAPTQPYEVAWQFVVTKPGATPVAASEVDAAKPADRMPPDWTWSTATPTVEFISVCPS